MPSPLYKVNDIFYSIQGEGHRAGTANVFVRLASCNLQCTRERDGFDCDTEFTSGKMMTGHEIREEAARLAGGDDGSSVIFTGGEPLLQFDRDLYEVFDQNGWFVCLETNGTLPLPAGVRVIYIACSPKTAEHTLKIGKVNELRYVRGANQALPEPKLEADHHFLSPAYLPSGEVDKEALANCIELVKLNPTEWRLSTQQHKEWNVE